MSGVVERFGILFDDFAVDLVGPATVVADIGGGLLDVDAGHGDGFAIIEGFDGSEDLEISFKELGEFG